MSCQIKKDIESIVQGDYYSAEKGDVYINLRKNIYTTGFKDIVRALINLDNYTKIMCMINAKTKQNPLPSPLKN